MTTRDQLSHDLARERLAEAIADALRDDLWPFLCGRCKDHPGVTEVLYEDFERRILEHLEVAERNPR